MSTGSKTPPKESVKCENLEQRLQEVSIGYSTRVQNATTIHLAVSVSLYADEWIVYFRRFLYRVLLV